MASVQRRVQRGRTTYRAIWKERGRQRNKSFTSASAAKQFAARMANEIERRNVGDPRRQSVAQFLDNWLGFLRDRGEKAPTTLSGYARQITIACREIGELQLSDVSAADLDRAYSHLLKDGGRRHRPGQLRPLTARSVLNVHRCLSTAFKQARRWGLIANNPADDATAPSPEPSSARAFTATEVKQLLQEAARDPETYAIVATLMTCGLRRGELLGLAEDAVALHRRHVDGQARSARD
jgi:integrase